MEDTLQRCLNGRDGVSNHQPHDYLLNRFFWRRSKKTSKLRVTGLCAGKSPVNSPHKWPLKRKMFPFDDVIMNYPLYCYSLDYASSQNLPRPFSRNKAIFYQQYRCVYIMYPAAHTLSWNMYSTRQSIHSSYAILTGRNFVMLHTIQNQPYVS